jgi:hypothetical protein
VGGAAKTLERYAAVTVRIVEEEGAVVVVVEGEEEEELTS